MYHACNLYVITLGEPMLNDIKGQEYSVCSAEQLNVLGNGCFVRVNNQGRCCWVEVEQQDDNGELLGVVHPELEGSDESCEGVRCELSGHVRVHRDQVVELGCDRYCFC